MELKIFSWNLDPLHNIKNFNLNPISFKTLNIKLKSIFTLDLH